MPPVADWESVANVFPVTAAYPAEASIADDVFIAVPGADLSTVYAWDIDVSAMTLPHLCVIVPEDEAVFVAQFRGVYAAGMYISNFNTGAVNSYFFVIRPGDPTLAGVAQISTYQRHLPTPPARRSRQRHHRDSAFPRAVHPDRSRHVIIVKPRVPAAARNPAPAPRPLPQKAPCRLCAAVRATVGRLMRP